MKFGIGEFGSQIAELRAGAGLTLEEVARRARTHKGYISGIENGKVNPPAFGILNRLAKLFGLDKEQSLELKAMAVVEKVMKKDKELGDLIGHALSREFSIRVNQADRKLLAQELKKAEAVDN